MVLERIRWRLHQGVRAVMLGTTDAHPLRSAYRFVRRLPLVGGAWRALRGAERWRDVADYAAKGGAFAGDDGRIAGDPLPEFGTEAYFSALIARIRVAPAKPEPVEGRIVLVNNGLSAGGAERQIVYTLVGLKERGCDARFLGEYLGKAPGLDFHEATLKSAGVSVEPMPRKAGPGSQLYAGVTRAVAEALAAAPMDFMLDVLDAAAALRRQQPQVVHLWQDETSTKLAFAAMIAGASRIALSGRNLNPTHFAFHQPYMRGAYRALAAAPGVTLTNNTRAGANSYAAWLDLDPKAIRVIYNGFLPSAFAPAGPGERAAARRQYAIAPDESLVVGVFRLSPEKRPLLWIDTAVEALKRRADLVFLIAGSGPMAADLKTRIEGAGLAPKIRLVGEVNPVASVYAAADLLFLASSEEGAPNVLIEAQSAGLACVTTNAGGVCETVLDGETAIVVSDATPARLADALLTALDDRTLAERAPIVGPEFVADRFGIARMIDETLAAYGIAC